MSAPCPSRHYMGDKDETSFAWAATRKNSEASWDNMVKRVIRSDGAEGTEEEAQAYREMLDEGTLFIIRCLTTMKLNWRVICSPQIL